MLTCSFDFTVCIWSIDSDSGVWSIETTLGQMSGNKHNYYGALFVDSHTDILAYTYNGALQHWIKSEEGWVSTATVTGHFNEVTDLDWDPTYSYLVSTSLDQTTRIFTPWLESRGGDNLYHEVSRPQVHGYDINAIKFVNRPDIVSSLLSGGDEKVVRMFEP